MNYWFTSDYHLGHANIIKYCNRPFKNLQQMNDTIIRKHNERVKTNDTVFHVGDFCFKNSSNKDNGIRVSFLEWKNKLNGNIIYIKGNHDKNNGCKTMIERLVITFSDYQINLTHKPIYACKDYDINFVGHIHDKWEIKRFRIGETFTDCINVGVDVWNFYPVKFNEIIKRYVKWLKMEYNG